MKINYSVLQPMDIVLTSDRGIFPYITRLVTVGWKKRHSIEVATHAGIVVKKDGLFEIAEMSPDPKAGTLAAFKAKAIFSYFSKYTTGKFFSPRIVTIKRFPLYEDSKIRNNANKRVIDDVKSGILYDYKGLLEFVGLCEDCPTKLYCSEFVRWETEKDGMKWDKKKEEKISPRDLQISDKCYDVKDWSKV